MSHKTQALFDALLYDLADHLPQYVIASLRAGENVDRWPDMSLEAMRSLALAKSFLKKFRDDIDQAETDRVALDKFRRVNQRSRDWRLELESSWDEVLYGEFKRLLYEFLNPEGYPLISSGDEIWSNAEVGPGAAIGTKLVDFYNKLFTSDLTCTSLGVYRSYRSYIAQYPEWANAEIIREATRGVPHVVTGNYLSFVPKDRNTSRTICVEPVLNMYGQLGIGNLIRERLKSFFGIDLSTQPDVNRDLARRGSIDGTQATLDLESASDSISLSMLRAALPRDFLSWLELFRAPVAKLPDGSYEELAMVSTMGNGYTFPLQTLLFSCVVVASLRARGFDSYTEDASRIRPRNSWLVKTWGVFGDDIIVPTNFHYFKDQWPKRAAWFGSEIVRDVQRLLSLLGFTVNATKSFTDVEDPFRESCGGDFFRGHPVRGVYVKTLKTKQARFVAINRLNEWSATSGIPLRRVVQKLLLTVRVSSGRSKADASLPFLPVPPWEQDDAGVKTPWSMVRNLRANPKLQSVIYRRFVPLRRTVSLREDAKVFGAEGGSFYNMSGLLLSVLNGTIRAGGVAVRANGNVPYRLDLGVAPSWGYYRVELSLPEQEAHGQRWEAAARLNLKR